MQRRAFIAGAGGTLAALSGSLGSRSGQDDGTTPTTESRGTTTPTARSGEPAAGVTVEVTNEGSTASRFIGALNRVGPLVAYTRVARLSELVAPGERTTISVADSWGGMPADERIGDDTADVTYRLAFVGGEDSADVRLVG